jgi:hypothetical protein
VNEKYETYLMAALFLFLLFGIDFLGLFFILLFSADFDLSIPDVGRHAIAAYLLDAAAKPFS